MPSEEKIINTNPEYVRAQRVRIGYGETKEVSGIPGFAIRFIDVTRDTRCPIGVLCEIAGWATVTVEAILPGQTVQEELHIQGGNRTFYRIPSEKDARPGSGNILRIGDSIIYAADLFPYPVTMQEIRKEDYVMTLFIDTEKNVAERKHLAELARTELEKHVTDHRKYYVLDIETVSGLHGEQKKVTFFDPMSVFYHKEDEAKKYFVLFSWQQAWIPVEFREE